MRRKHKSKGGRGQAILAELRFLLLVIALFSPRVGAETISSGAYHSLALLPDGAVAAWGKSESGKSAVPAGLTGVVQASAGGLHSVALPAVAAGAMA